MNRISRFAGRVISLTLVICTGLGLVVPGTSIADGSSNATAAFCSKVLPARQNQFENSVSRLKSKVASAWQAQDTRLKTLAATVDANVATDRKAADAQRQSDYSKLMAKATTDAEKSAVQTYETAVNSAVSTKRSDDTAAVATFRQGVKTAIETRRSTITTQADTFKSSVEAAFSAATGDCQSGASANSIRTILISSLRAARQTFVSERQSESRIGDQVAQLAATRDSAFKANQSTFKASMQSAASALKSAFGSDSSNV